MRRGKISGSQLFIISLATLTFVVVFREQNKPKPPSDQAPVAMADRRPAEASTTIDKELAEKHAKVDEVMETLQKSQIFGNIRIANRVGRVVALPNFILAPFDDKVFAASIAYEWCRTVDTRCELLIIHESINNREIGRYGPTYGGLKMD